MKFSHLLTSGFLALGILSGSISMASASSFSGLPASIPSLSNSIGSLSSGTIEIQVNFSRLSGLRVGAPVFLGEKRVGVVSKVSAAQVKRGAKSAEFLVRIALDGSLKDSLLTGTVALISAPVVSAKVSPQSSVQLLLPKAQRKERSRKLRNGKPIRGFSSYQEYWSAGALDRG